MVDDATTPWTVLTAVRVAVESAAVVLEGGEGGEEEGEGGGEEASGSRSSACASSSSSPSSSSAPSPTSFPPDVLVAGLGGASLDVSLFPEAASFDVRIESVGVHSPEGALLTTGFSSGDAAAAAAAAAATSPSSSSSPSPSSSGRRRALDVAFVRRPQDALADARLRVSLAPSFVTWAPRALRRVAAFFRPERPLRLSALGAAAAVGAEKARRAAGAALAAHFLQ